MYFSERLIKQMKQNWADKVVSSQLRIVIMSCSDLHSVQDINSGHQFWLFVKER